MTSFSMYPAVSNMANKFVLLVSNYEKLKAVINNYKYYIDLLFSKKLIIELQN